MDAGIWKDKPEFVIIDSKDMQTQSKNGRPVIYHKVVVTPDTKRIIYMFMTSKNTIKIVHKKLSRVYTYMTNEELWQSLSRFVCELDVITASSLPGCKPIESMVQLDAPIHITLLDNSFIELKVSSIKTYPRSRLTLSYLTTTVTYNTAPELRIDECMKRFMTVLLNAYKLNMHDTERIATDLQELIKSGYLVTYDKEAPYNIAQFTVIRKTDNKAFRFTVKGMYPRKYLLSIVLDDISLHLANPKTGEAGLTSACMRLISQIEKTVAAKRSSNIASMKKNTGPISAMEASIEQQAEPDLSYNDPLAVRSSD